jgi:hypothetical protein
MSDLLNKASLVVIPSGYKEDTVYSVVPSDGSGDLSFTRASNGTRVNSAGLVEVTPWNLVQQSETLTNAIWNLYSGSSVTSNSQTAPNGTLTADTLNSTTIDYSGIYQSLGSLPTNVYTYSMYAKAGTNSFFYMLAQGNGNQRAFFNLSTGVVGATQNIDSASIESVGNGWYRCQIQKTGAGIEMFVGSSNIEATLPTANGTVFLWGAQLNIGSTAKPYFPTTDRLNVPRLTYQNGGGGCPSLLLEKQSTNLFTYSEELQTGTVGTITVTPNATTSPDGTQNADLLSTSGYLIKVLSATAGTYTYSVFAKYSSQNTINISIYDGSYYDATYNLITGVVSSASAGVTASIQNFGNGWYRCIVTATTANNVSEVDLNSGNVYVWGCQFEAGSYPTSYIPTTSSSATRVADKCFKTGISSLIGQTEGTLFIDINRNYITSSYDRYFAVDDGDATIYRTGIFIIPEPSIDGRVYIEIRSNSVGIFGFTYNSTSVSNLKIAVAYKNNDMAIYINGTQSATSSASLTFAHTLSKIASYGNGQSIKESVIFPTRLTNAELASITSL